MKRSKIKCFGLLSVLFIMLGLSLGVFSPDVNALKHEYNGILYGSHTIPYPTYDSVADEWSFNWASPDPGASTYDGSGFKLEFKGDSYNSSEYDNLDVKYSASYVGNHISFNYFNDGTCTYLPDGHIYPIFRFISNSQISTNIGDPVSSLYTASNSNWNKCNRVGKKYGDGMPSYNSNHDVTGLLTCDKSNGAVCGGLWNASEYLHSQVLPYPYSSNGFYLHSKAISDEGIHYSNTFSFSDMFNSYIPTFSYLSIPLHTTDGYFLNPDNLSQDREFEIAGSFEFDGSFNWHDNISTNGSYFRVSFQGFPRYGSDSNWIDNEYACTTNLITLGGPNSLTRLDYSCPFTLEESYLFITGLRLEISGNNNYVWTTDKPWRFASTYIITDNDDTLGDSFNDDISGGGTIIGDARNNIPVSDPGSEFFNSLVNLFSFNFINPFSPIFDLFTNNSSCVNIPTIASLLHSQDSQVCPWFDSNVRNITTPVLGLSSLMLVFGFAVRWLGSSSGNLFEDGKDETLSNFGGSWKRYKKGGK